MKISSITQTYGSRELEMNTVFSNSTRTKLANKLDLVCLNFHNVPENLIKIYEEKAKKCYHEVNCRTYNNVPYGYTIYSRLKELQSVGYTDIFFCQDDHYLLDHRNSEITVNAILDFYRSRSDINILYLSPSYETEAIADECLEEVKLIEHLKCNKFDTRTWNKISGYAYDDSPYFAKIDFLLANVFTKEKVNMDVWNMEYSTNIKWKSESILRWTCNTSLGYLANFSGRNVNSNISVEDKLKQIKCEIPSGHSENMDKLFSFMT